MGVVAPMQGPPRPAEYLRACHPSRLPTAARTRLRLIAFTGPTSRTNAGTFGRALTGFPAIIYIGQ
jgi:hypothetical protein